VKAEQRKDLINLLRKVIYELTGNYYPEERMKILEYKVERLIKDLNLNVSSPEEIVSYFRASPEREKTLIDLMTVPETRFFREKEQLDILFEEVIKDISTLSIASVGCSTGQEPYTLAMIMEKKGISGKIIGMDINVKVLEEARKGVYKSEEIKDIPPDYRDFVYLKDSVMCIKDKIKKRVDFYQANLIRKEDFMPFSGNFGIVFCRNVLIYFDSDSKRIALENLALIMKKKGILVLSSTEILSRELQILFETFKKGKFFFYRKRKNL